MITLNTAAVTALQEAIEAGRYNTAIDWEFTETDDDSLLGDPADWDRYAQAHLGFDDSVEESDRARYRHPVAKVNADGDLVIHRQALLAVIDSEPGEEIAGQARELIGSIDSEVSEESAEDLADTGDSDTSGGEKPLPDVQVDGGGRAMQRAPDQSEKPSAMLYRDAMIDSSGIDRERRTVPLSCSSKHPVRRFSWEHGAYLEVLDHSPGAIRMDYIRNVGAVLLDHWGGSQVGAVAKFDVENERTVALARFSRSQLGSEVFTDVADEIRKGVSIGYIVHDMELLERSKDGPDTYLVTDWEPYEVSLVAIPADPTVGVGRSHSDRREDPLATIITRARRNADGHDTEVDMPKRIDQAAPNASDGDLDTRSKDGEDTAVAVLDEDAKDVSRIRAIEEYGRLNNAAEFARHHINEGTSVEEFRVKLLEQLGTDHLRAAELPDPNIGMSEREQKEYRVTRLLHALLNPTDTRAQQAAGFEFEASRAYADKVGDSKRGGVFVPGEVMGNPRDFREGQRVLQAGQATQAAELVDYRKGGELIEFMYGASVLLSRARVTRLPFVLELPRQVTPTLGEWPAAENTALTAGAIDEITFDTVKWQPKSLGAMIGLSRKLLAVDSEDGEMIAREDLGRGLGHSLDRGGIQGNGAGGLAGSIVGLLYYSGVNVAAWADLPGVTGVSSYYELALLLEQLVAEGNFDDPDMFYLTSPKVRALAKGSPMFSGGAIPAWMMDNTLNGYRAVATTKSPDDLTASNYSAMAFVNGRECHYNLFTGIELVVDPYTKKNQNIVEVAAWTEADFQIRRPGSCARCVDVQ